MKSIIEQKSITLKAFLKTKDWYNDNYTYFDVTNDTNITFYVEDFVESIGEDSDNLTIDNFLHRSKFITEILRDILLVSFSTIDMQFSNSYYDVTFNIGVSVDSNNEYFFSFNNFVFGLAESKTLKSSSSNIERAKFFNKNKCYNISSINTLSSISNIKNAVPNSVGVSSAVPTKMHKATIKASSTKANTHSSSSVCSKI